MISKGANVSAQDEIGRTPLHIAAQYNNVEIKDNRVIESDIIIRRQHHV